MKAKLAGSWFVGAIGAALFSLLSSATAFGAQDNKAVSGNSLLEGCQAAVNEASSRQFQQGYCLGVIFTVGEMSPNVCPGNEVTALQSLRVVVKYMENHPESLHESFRALAIRALSAAFPCKQHKP
jgi:Rap1a immunity proteins